MWIALPLINCIVNEFLSLGILNIIVGILGRALDILKNISLSKIVVVNQMDK